jgi:hypothetical protein
VLVKGPNPVVCTLENVMPSKAAESTCIKWFLGDEERFVIDFHLFDEFWRWDIKANCPFSIATPVNHFLPHSEGGLEVGEVGSEMLYDCVSDG